MEPRAEAQHEARSLTLARSSDGMYRGRIALAPDAAAVWINTLQALITPRAAPRFVSEDDYVEQTITADTRTGPQKMADAATEVFSRVAASPDTPRLAGATTTVNVHVTLTDIERGSGPGWVDGLDEPVPMSVVARLRCTSPTVTTVFGDRGEVLHHGKARRLFTGAQNRALAARDGGCIWPGCDRPPSWCETHHVDEWMSHSHPPGRTDIDNGVLLCRFHHSHLHKSSWRLVMSEGVPHVVPPRWIDVSQTPIRVARRRTLPAARSGPPTAGARPLSHGFDPPPRHASPDHDDIRNTDARGSG
ncbi:HNH endonuclease signature motif containing protein [Herbiconiux daphne]|uniref:HNH endonuclease n=1 Tax=Herbiconiux daphne TaxID=2970914 RepID=A0ABT2H0K6_9MICO|nr:HNH endonuclease signature motif containing protein [Herbiconiux daphne]MCS5733451.1 HNH endonuclease [Herbiconiux daphne]